ncbi:MAG: thiamine phosphate synthase [Myxococcales bacterium]|nr:thiamine phosphate synthase [Myxococcales bacterium]
MARRASELGSRPILCAVLDASGLGPDPGARAGALFEAGVDWIQLRDRTLEDDVAYRLLRALCAARDRASADRPRVLVNRRVDLALAAGADGVHLGFDAVDARTARGLLGAGALLGASLHTIAEVEAAASAGALDYAHLAPIWDPISKPATREALGPDRLAQAARLGLALLAQGGVDAQRVGAALAAGAAGVAVTGALARPGEAAAAIVPPLRRALDAAAQSHPPTAPTDAGG